MPQFSIIIPTYNRGYILWKTLISIQQQTYTDFECLVIDDGSTDDTEKIIRLFSDDDRIHYHKQSNQGAGAARQAGMNVAKGTIITFIDSDDPVYSNYLMIANQIFENNGIINYCLSNCNFYVDLLDKSHRLLASKHVITHKEPVELQDIYN